jgi:hypothetical protein
MKNRGALWTVIGALAFLSLGFARAEAAEVLYDGSGFLQGTQSFVQSFNISTPGTLTVTLSNVAWPEQLASLNLLLTTDKGVLGPEMGAGTSTFDIQGGVDVFAQWFGTAQGPLNTGVYSMLIEFQPTAGVPVPLPTSIALLLSGLSLLIWQRRTRDAAPGQVFGSSRDVQAT